MNRDILESAIRAVTRSIRAVTTSAQMSILDEARLSRARIELGINHWSVGKRNGIWISTLEVEWFGPKQETAKIVGEGHDPLSAERDAFWHLARFYASRAHDLNDQCRRAVAA